MTKNCYDCKHQRDIPGNAHIKCAHPIFDELHKDPMMEVVSIMGGGLNPTEVVIASKAMGFRPNPHGYQKGWFNFPVNFDPTWINGECLRWESSDE